MKARSWALRSSLLVKIPRLSSRRVRIEKNSSIWFSHEAWVGVKIDAAVAVIHLADHLAAVNKQRGEQCLHAVARRRLLVPVENIVQDVNRFLRGWTGYFRHGNSARHFLRMMTYATGRLALLIAKRHRRSRGYGWWTVVHRSPDRLGLINLNGHVVAPRPHRSQ